MSVEQIRITVKVSGAEKAKKQIQGVSNVAKKTRKEANLLGNTLKSLGTFLVAKKIMDYADAWTQINNRIRLVTNSASEQAEVQEKLFAISQRTRNEFEATALIYGRLALATRNTGLSQTDLLRVVETLNKQILIGGNNAKEASMGLIQFAQGIASGKLQGDELRSVMENLLGVQVALIRGFQKLHQAGKIDFRVTKANIRSLASEGVLTPNLILKAMLTMSKETDEAFSNLNATISQSFTVLSNAALKWIGEAEEASGVSKLLSTGIVGIADNLDLVVSSLAKAGVGWALYKTGMKAAKATSNRFSETLISLPIGDGEKKIVKVTRRIETLGGASKKVNLGMKRTLQIFSDLIGKLGALTFFVKTALKTLLPFGAIWAGIEGAIWLFTKSTEEATISLKEKNVYLQAYQDNLERLYPTLEKVNEETEKSVQIEKKLKEVSKTKLKILTELKKATEELKNPSLFTRILFPESGVEDQRKKIEELGRAYQGLEVIENRVADNTVAIEKDFLAVVTSISEFRTKVEGLTTSLTQQQKISKLFVKELDNINNKIKQNIQLEAKRAEMTKLVVDAYTDGVKNIRLGELNKSISKFIDDYGTSLSKLKSSLTESEKASVDFKAVQTQLNAQFRLGGMSLEEYNKQSDLLIQTYEEFGEALEASKLDERMKKISDSMEDSITDGIMNIKGELSSLKEFAGNIFRSIAAEMVRTQISKPLANFASSFLGDIFGSMLGAPSGGNFGNAPSSITPDGFTRIPGRANGGTVSGNSPYIVGENGAELFIPNRTGSIVPNGTNIGGDTIVNVSYSPQVNALDPRTAATVIAQNASTIVGVVRQAFNRSGQSVVI